MPSYSAIANSDIDQDSPLTDALLTLLRDNPIAIAEGANNAPYARGAWHPYDQTTVGAGTGVIFNSGTTTTIDSGTFDAGYDYMMRINGLTHNALASVLLQINRSSSGWLTMATLTVQSAGVAYYGDWYIPLPGESTRALVANSEKGIMESGGSADLFGSVKRVYSGTTESIVGMRLALTAGSFNGGEVFLLRRRNYGLGT